MGVDIAADITVRDCEMRHRRRVVNAKDIRRIAGKWRQVGYVEFEFLQYPVKYI